MLDEAAGSVGPAEAASESHNSERDAAESLQQGGSVNWGQGVAQSPRVPRSQISRAHTAHNAGFGERTSAVLSALSGDDETALSAAEAAGEHTSELQEAKGGLGEVQGGVAALGSTLPGTIAAIAVPQQPANSLTAPAPRVHELAGSPPTCTSPIYRANSVVSYTAAPNIKAQQQLQLRRGAETPASGPAVQLLGPSTSTSRGEFSAAVPQTRTLRLAAGSFSAGPSGLLPTLGQQHGVAQYQHAAGPSRPSLSGNQAHAATAATSLPSTMAVALGTFSPQGGALPGQLTPQHGAMAALQPTPLPLAYGTTGMAGLRPLAASLGLQPAQLGSMAAVLLQVQSQQQQQQQVASQEGLVMPLPPPPQAQQANALHSAAVMPQAQTFAVIGDGSGGSTTLPHVPSQQHGMPAVVPAVSQTAAVQPAYAHAGQQQAAAVSLGAAPSIQSLGASAIQGHPLPPPFYGTGTATTPAPLQSFGGTLVASAPQGAAAVPHTVQGSAFAALPLYSAPTATPLQAATVPALSEMQGSAMQPAATALLEQAHYEEQQRLAGVAGQNGDPALAAHLQQAASVVVGSGNGGGHGSGFCRSPSTDPEQRAAEDERRRHADDPPQPQAAVIVDLPTADVAAASQGGGEAGGDAMGLHVHLPPAVPQEAAMLGGNYTCADDMEVGEEDDDDAMEVQQAAAEEGQGGHLPPAPHGAASVMATLITDNGGGRSEGDTDMQQTASGPSRHKAAAAQSRSMAEPAAATAHNMGARSALTAGGTATQPSQQGPATSHRGWHAHALSSLATASTGSGERAGGSVKMRALPSQQEAAQYATSAPAPTAGAAQQGEASTAPVPPRLPQGQAAGVAMPHHAAGVTSAPSPRVTTHAAASAPAAAPPQVQVEQLGGVGTPPLQPAVSASMSGQGDTPGLAYFDDGAMPQSSTAATAPPPLQQGQQAQQVASAVPPAFPAYTSVWEGHDGRVPLTDSRSRSQGAAAAAAAAAQEGMGSLAASMLAGAGGQPHESEGTARGTILAGAAHSILTTAAAAAGEGEAMDEGGEALSPLLAAKVLLAHVPGGNHAEAGPSVRPGATPHTGSVSLHMQLFPAPVTMAASSGKAGKQQLQEHPTNGYPKPLPHSASTVAELLGGNNGSLGPPIDLSTMAVDLAPAGGDNAPQPSASGQPSSLPPPGAVAATMAALEQQQAAQGGGVLTPPPAAAELGDLYYVLQQQNGYTTHANSAIGNAHVAQSSPERELPPSPSRLITHDSTGAGSDSKQAAKRRRTSVGPAGSAQHA